MPPKIIFCRFVRYIQYKIKQSKMLCHNSTKIFPSLCKYCLLYESKTFCKTFQSATCPTLVHFNVHVAQGSPFVVSRLHKISTIFPQPLFAIFRRRFLHVELEPRPRLSLRRLGLPGPKPLIAPLAQVPCSRSPQRYRRQGLRPPLPPLYPPTSPHTC